VGNTSSPVVASGRPREQRVVTSRVLNEYFKVGPGAPYATSGEILRVTAQRYIAGGLIPVTADYIMDAFSIYPATTPSRTTYTGWAANAAANQWQTGPVANPGSLPPGQIVAEDSRITRWMGNIWRRQTRYVLAE
jgi:hypothetical protein